MSKAVAPRINGDDYQARWFWLKACDLLEPHTHTTMVVIEDKTHKGLDDVVVYYKDGKRDVYGNPVHADYYQVKFHVTHDGALTAGNLTDPSFINATKFSFLQRVQDAVLRDPRSQHCRFIMYSPWGIDQRDGLKKVVSNDEGQIDWDRLKIGGDRSELGRIRKLWREHLRISSDEELRMILERIRLRVGPELGELGRRLSERLSGVGLKPFNETSILNPYDDLARKLITTGQTAMHAGELERVCRQAELWDGGPKTKTSRTTLGVRSFSRWAEDLQDQCEHFTCLLSCFDGRTIKTPELWQSQVRAKLQSMLESKLRPGKKYLLHLDAHQTIAFLSGYLVPSKVGADIAVLQKSGSGISEWECAKSSSSLAFEEDWNWNEENLLGGGEGLLLGISITHDVHEDVLLYANKNLPHVGKGLFLSHKKGPSHLNLPSGSYAYELAELLVNKLNEMRKVDIALAPVHIFASAPNGFMFLFGRLAQPIRNWVMYEYDFDTMGKGAYSPSIKNTAVSANREQLALETITKGD